MRKEEPTLRKLNRGPHHQRQDVIRNLFGRPPLLEQLLRQREGLLLGLRTGEHMLNRFCHAFDERKLSYGEV